jgi:5-(carboxyamino)imidazole ribonucleotide synthase
MSATTLASPEHSPNRAHRAPVVAMVGAGQLARMTQQAAIALGITLRVLTDDAADSALRAGAVHVHGSPDRLEDLRALADGADVLTFDHERVAPEHLAALQADGVRLAPSAGAKLLAQDKLHARRDLARAGFPVPPFAHARSTEEVTRFATVHGWPLVAKALRGGYDGRGVFTLADPADAEHALTGGPDGLLLEPRLQIERELAVLVARSALGETAAYPVVQTVQHEAMCREILAPAPIAAGLAARARDLALAIADHIGATGVLAVELFDTSDGLLVNELALRPHNSGHYTIEGCATSQFEQHLRAVLGWPLGSPTLLAPAVVTVNIIGPADGSDPASRIADGLSVPGAHIHLYAKTPRPGRKLGHVTVCGQDLTPTRHAAQFAADQLQGTGR